MEEKRPVVILSIDDSAEVRSFLRTVLEDQGFKFEEASTGSEGLAALALDPDIVLLDVNLPDMSGFDICKQIRSVPKYSTIPIIHTTGQHRSTRDQVTGLEAGADAYLVQPADIDVLLATVRTLLRAHDAERALRESEGRFRRLVENSPDFVYRYELRPVRGCSYASPASGPLTGYSSEECLSDPDIVLKLTHTDDVQQARAFLEDPLTHSEATVRWIRKDGRLIWVSIRQVPVLSDDGSPITVVGTVRDITERIKGMESLKESEQRYSSLFEHIDSGFSVHEVLMDESGRPVDLVCLQVNPEFERLSGIKAEDIIGRPASEVFPSFQHTRSKWMDAVRHVMPTGKSTDFELHIPHLDKWLKVHAYRPATGRFAAVFSDVTSQRQAEQALTESERLYRTLVEAMDDAVLVKDLDGRYLMVNSEAASRFGLPKEEILGRTTIDLYGPDQAREVMDHDNRVILTGQPVEAIEHYPERVHAPICHVRKVPLRGDDGELQGVVTVSRNVTEQKQMEDQLLRANRLETAGRIAGQVAHDFNNLLGPIAAYPELIKMRIPSDEVLASYCDSMLSAAKQMADINEDMMALARRGRFVQHAVDTNSLVREVLDNLVELPPTIDVHTSLSPALLPSLGSASQLSRVLVNLIHNAADAIHGSGSITISTENVYIDRPLRRYNLVETGEYVAVSVRDSGTGIPPEIQDKIFDAFFTTKSDSNRRGCGLGLSVVQAIVQDHAGYLDLESEVGHGTIFTVYLPVHRGAAEAQPNGSLPTGKGQRILVVDDDEGQREVVGRMLEALGYEVETVSSGDEAIERLGEKDADLVLLDMVMPGGLDGLETYRRMSAIRPGQRAIIFSGFAATSALEEVQALGAGRYLRKPLTMETLAKAVRSELDRWGRELRSSSE